MDLWTPYVDPHRDLVWPVRLDPRGVRGPTRGQARGRAWRRCARGWYVPASVDPDDVEQRILEQAVRVVGTEGALSGWAALRWRGAAYFDGHRPDGSLAPVDLLRLGGGASLPPGPARFSGAQLAPTETELVRGVPCATVERSLFDVMRFAGSVRQAVVAADMVSAAGLLSIAGLAEFVSHKHAWEGVPQTREAVALASDDSRSPQESWLRLCWLLDAELPPPVCNQPVFDLEGRLLGYPDLLEPTLGVVGEYDGAHHLRTAQRAQDLAREDRMRAAGLEYFSVVGGELRHRDRVAQRMRDTWRRARRRTTEERGWTLEPPPWWGQRRSA
ncbi:hypothetical protein [Nocardioides sp.]|uniref:hypothetical protein n=1 Tax=Nocardioides sp. TaxID=35761 RepID=UPI003529583F